MCCAGCLQAARCSSLGKLHAVMASHQAHRWDLLTPAVLFGKALPAAASHSTACLAKP